MTLLGSHDRFGLYNQGLVAEVSDIAAWGHAAYKPTVGRVPPRGALRIAYFCNQALGLQPGVRIQDTSPLQGPNSPG